jgi:wobble nucleotide-excising tRNase
MIETISIASVATYANTPETLSGLSQLNYLFGSNATGKTTISRVIADESNFPTCSVTWKGGNKLETKVYNCDFVDRNFHQPAELKGVFTLGEKQVDTLAKIETAKAELDEISAKIEALTQGLQGVNGAGGKKGELASLETGFRDKCWAQKQKHDARLQGGFEGYRSSSEKFRAKVLQEFASNSSALQTQEELEKKAESVFGPTPTAEVPIAALDTINLIAYESEPILKKRVIGKDDVDIAAMIKKLGNSDWIREGRAFYDLNDGTCPFCQQNTAAAFGRSLDEYFDETFVTDSKAIDTLVTNYAIDAAKLQHQLASIIAASPKFLDVEKLKAEKELLDTKITVNSQRLAGKKKEASQVVTLESLSGVLTTIKALFDSANNRVAAHNKMVANLAAERAALTAQIWRFVVNELRNELAAFMREKDGLDKAIAAMTTRIVTMRSEMTKKAEEIRELERQTTSVQPTIDGINQLLVSFGFQGFKLAKAASGTSYKLVRSDGSDAKATLSEGEKTFVTFLYFYHLLKGSESDSGMTTDRVVVFDDPVSSLDSDILFIVGSLIKGLFDEVCSGSGHIKQIFVLTHNVYFHKEVTYSSKRPNKGKLKGETFWLVRRPGLASKVEEYLENPVKTSYQLLWAEVQKPERSNLAIQNTLRRILENYFKILGGFEFDQLCSMFDGREKIICRSLCSWVHDGSHYAHDDLYVSIDSSTVENHLKIFRAIFTKAGHAAHYKMMMADAFVEEPVTELTTTSAPATPSP